MLTSEARSIDAGVPTPEIPGLTLSTEDLVIGLSISIFLTGRQNKFTAAFLGV